MSEKICIVCASPYGRPHRKECPAYSPVPDWEATIAEQAATIERLESALHAVIVKEAKLRESAAKQLTLMACAGVERLEHLAPDERWDSGERVAEMYIRDLDPPKQSIPEEQSNE